MTLKIVQLLPASVAGVALGSFYFTGLWWTVRKLTSAHSPALLSLGSFLLRTTVVLAGFYVVMAGQWERLVACLLGFMIARMLLVKRFKPARVKKSSPFRDARENLYPK